MIIISDVHANYVALKEVLEHIDKSEKIVHAGDVIGYNPYPNETISLFLEYHITSILGNHDKSVITSDYTHFNYIAEIAARWTESVLNQTSWKYLKSLKSSIYFYEHEKKVAIHHGAPFNENYYIYEYDVSPTLLKYDSAQILILGHTHVPYIKKYTNALICNPGSVGQPRDHNPRAAYIELDIEAMSCTIKRVTYNVKEVVDKILEQGLPEVLGTRLFYGV